jgi:hypothetical protein
MRSAMGAIARTTRARESDVVVISRACPRPRPKGAAELHASLHLRRAMTRPTNTANRPPTKASWLRVRLLAASLPQSTEDTPSASSVAPADLESIPPVLSVRPSGFEPLTYGSGASNVRLVGSSKASQGVESVRVGAGGRVQPVTGNRRASSPFAAPVLQALVSGAASPRAAPRLLKVGEVAERLGVSTATVYALCKCSGWGRGPSPAVAGICRVKLCVCCTGAAGSDRCCGVAARRAAADESQ